MKMNKRQITLYGSNIEGNELNPFMTIFLVEPYLKNNKLNI